MPSAFETFQLKIHLLGISLMVWRRVLVSSSTTLRELHGILQVAMGWDAIHLFQFDIRAVVYGSWELHAAGPDIPLSEFGFRRNDRFSYIYDMGDHWKHEIRVEAILYADPKKPCPVCTGAPPCARAPVRAQGDLFTMADRLNPDRRSATRQRSAISALNLYRL